MFRLFLAIACALGVVAAAVGFAACSPSTTATGLTPITGVVIRSSSLVAGHGCGTAPTQVYKYLAIVANKDQDTTSGAPVAYAEIFDCFADGVFVNLVASAHGSLNFNVDIFAYSAADYEKYATNIDATRQARPEIDPVTRAIPNPPPATWTTTCEAQQQQDIIVLAVCAPLSSGGPSASDGGDVDAGLARIIVNTARFAHADASDYACDVGDGGDGGDGGASGDYVSTRLFYSFTIDGGPEAGLGQSGPSLACPQPHEIIARPTATYLIDVTLERDGASPPPPRCTATAIAGQSVTATCSPAP